MREIAFRIQHAKKVAGGVVLVLLGLVISLSQPVPAHAQAAISATNDRAALIFPVGITFSIDLSSNATISKVVLEYGVDKLTCAPVTSSAIPTFTASKNVTATWTWEMRTTGSEPAGARIWWRWRVTNADGKELVTDRQSITWLDNKHEWQTIKGDRLILHWYLGDKNFGTVLFDSANKSLADLEVFTGLTSDAPPDVYIYGSNQAMLEARLFAPTWSGGVAYAHYNIVLIGIALQDITWGKGALAHELTHVLDLRANFSCLNNRPTWLVEGLAEVGEGGLDSYSQGIYNTALAQNTFMSVRSLGGNFPDDRVYLAYAQSWSLVNYLLTGYGKDKFWLLLRALQQGATIDDALRSTYNFDQDGLEDVWRAKVGAKPRPNAGQSAAVTTPTAVPTAALVAGFQFPTPTFTATPNPTATQVPPTLVAVIVPVATATRAPVAPTAPEPSPTPGLPIGWLIGGILALVVGGFIAIPLMKPKKENLK